jgi:hypothetical protein
MRAWGSATSASCSASIERDLADAGFADHGDNLSLTLASQAPAVEQQPHFVRAPDEW